MQFHKLLNSFLRYAFLPFRPRKANFNSENPHKFHLSIKLNTKISMAAPMAFDTYINFRPKTTPDLMQNCDLPPPAKLVSAPDRSLLPSIIKTYAIGTDGDGELEILTALRRSQTRATAAERKVRILSEDKAALSRMIVEESMVLFAHRQWVNLLEIRVSKLERERREEERERAEEEEGRWRGLEAIALCFAIAGVGFVISYRYFS